MAGETQPPNQMTEALQRAAQAAQRQQSKGQSAPQQDGRFPNDRSGGRDDNRNGRGGRGDFRSEGRDYQGDRGRGGRGGGNGRGQWQNNDGRSDGYRNDGQRNDPRFEGNQNGGFAARAEQQPVQTEAKDKKPIAGQEVRPQKNRTAELILELGSVSFPIKYICVYLLKYLEVGNTETSEVISEKLRLTEDLQKLIAVSDGLLENITSEEKKYTAEDLEKTKSQVKVRIMKLLFELDILDSRIAKKLPKENTPGWRTVETAKNQLRKFIDANESITPLPKTLRPDEGFTPKLASAETVAVKALQNKELTPDEYSVSFAELIEKAGKGEPITKQYLTERHFTDKQADDFLELIK